MPSPLLCDAKYIESQGYASRELTDAGEAGVVVNGRSNAAGNLPCKTLARLRDRLGELAISDAARAAAERRDLFEVALGARHIALLDAPDAVIGESPYV